MATVKLFQVARNGNYQYVRLKTIQNSVQVTRRSDSYVIINKFCTEGKVKITPSSLDKTNLQC